DEERVPVEPERVAGVHASLAADPTDHGDLELEELPCHRERLRAPLRTSAGEDDRPGVSDERRVEGCRALDARVLLEEIELDAAPAEQVEEALLLAAGGLAVGLALEAVALPELRRELRAGNVHQRPAKGRDHRLSAEASGGRLDRCLLDLGASHVHLASANASIDARRGATCVVGVPHSSRNATASRSRRAPSSMSSAQTFVASPGSRSRSYS